MGASLGAARGPSRRAPELVRDRFNSQAATASWGLNFRATPARRGRRGPSRHTTLQGVDLSPLYDHLTAPRGRARSLPHSAEAGGAPCGDLVCISLDVEGALVTAAGFEAEGCAAARAAGSAVVELAAGKPFLEVARITPDGIAH